MGVKSFLVMTNNPIPRRALTNKKEKEKKKHPRRDSNPKPLD